MLYKINLRSEYQYNKLTAWFFHYTDVMQIPHMLFIVLMCCLLVQLLKKGEFLNTAHYCVSWSTQKQPICKNKNTPC